MATNYTVEDIASIFNGLTHKQQLDTLFTALDYMQQYNGRSRWECISLALGYSNTEGLNSTFVKNTLTDKSK